MNWLAEYRNADAEGEWLACGKARISIEYAKGVPDRYSWG